MDMFKKNITQLGIPIVSVSTFDSTTCDVFGRAIPCFEGLSRVLKGYPVF